MTACLQMMVCPRLSNKEARSLLACAVAALRLFLEEHSLRPSSSPGEGSRGLREQITLQHRSTWSTGAPRGHISKATQVLIGGSCCAGCAIPPALLEELMNPLDACRALCMRAPRSKESQLVRFLLASASGMTSPGQFAYTCTDSTCGEHNAQPL